MGQYAGFPPGDPAVRQVDPGGGGEACALAGAEEVESLQKKDPAALRLYCSEAVRDTDYVPNSAAILYMNSIVTGTGIHSAELTVSLRSALPGIYLGGWVCFRWLTLLAQ